MSWGEAAVVHPHPPRRTLSEGPNPRCNQVRHLRPGDRAVPLLPAAGTWRSGGVFDAEGWHPVPEGMPDDAAATLCIK